jgi:RNA polymerase sigma factor (sigma-70 family)
MSPLEGETNTLVCGQAAPDVQAARHEALRRIRSALDSLPARDVTILGLHYVEDLTYQEIAETLRITPSRVCQLLWRAVERVRNQLCVTQEAA